MDRKLLCIMSSRRMKVPFSVANRVHRVSSKTLLTTMTVLRASASFAYTKMKTNR